MPLPSGRGGSSSSHGLHGQGGPMMSEQHYGRHQHGPGGSGDNSSGNGQQHQEENQIYFRGNTAGLATVTEEDIFNAVGGLELVAEQEPDLAEYAAAAARGTAQLSDHSSEPSRVLVIRNVARDVSDRELQDIFKAFGDVQGLHTASKQLGLVVVAYYDLRAAISAQNTLQGTLINKMAIDVQFTQVTRNASGRPVNQGQVVVFNLDPDTSNEQLVWLFSKFGDVQGIKQAPSRPNQKFISYFDVRHAASAMRAMNRAEHLNKIPSYVTPQQIQSLQTSTSGPNLMQLAQLQGIDQAAAAAIAGNNGAGGWDGLGTPATMEGLLHLVNQQQQAQQQGSGGGMMQGGMDGSGGQSSHAFNRLGLESLAAANARGLPLSDSASSIASVPGGILMAGGNKGLPGHMSHMPGPNRNMVGLDNNHANMYGSAAERHAAQQQLHLMQAQEMLMGLNLGGMDKSQQASLWGTPDGQGGMGSMQDGSGAGLWPGAGGGPGGFLGGAGLNQLAALQELQMRQQQAAAVQQVQAFQAASGMGATNMGQLSAAANLQAAAQILQAAGLNQFGQGPYLNNMPYNTASAAQILQQAGLGLSGLGLNLGSMGGGMGMSHGGGGRGAGPMSGGDGGANSRNGGRLSRRTTDPIAEAERKAQQEKLYALDLDKINRHEDKRTTLMIKNIPNKYTQKMLLGTIDEHFKGTYDFFYLPIDFKNKCNVGYAFINMVQPINIIPLVQRFNHKKWERFNSEKVCNISYARIQGRSALVQHFQNSSLMHEDKRCRPILFTLEDSGDLAGEQEPFPPSSAASGPSSLAGGGSLGHGSGGSGTKLSGMVGNMSSNSLRSAGGMRSVGGSSNSLRELARHAQRE